MKSSRIVRRLEVITGVGGRRRWSEAEKARIIAEAMIPDAIVFEVARRHGMSPQQLLTWQRTAFGAAAAASRFVPAIVEMTVPYPSGQIR